MCFVYQNLRLRISPYNLQVEGSHIAGIKKDLLMLESLQTVASPRRTYLARPNKAASLFANKCLGEQGGGGERSDLCNVALQVIAESAMYTTAQLFCWI